MVVFVATEADIVSYFTLIYGVIDMKTGAGKLCQGGHPTPLLLAGWKCSAGRRRWRAGGADRQSLMGRCQLLAGAGERLCLFSDGITECENLSGEQFGDVRLQGCLQDGVRLSLPTLLAEFAGHLLVGAMVMAVNRRQWLMMCHS